ncbi:MAG TPA: PQQ-dependent sugar dehydrogenase [Pelobium sp.]|nr:PQQ-dependent sugar dehydrogenase [Pelobium sp.]
MQKLIFPTIGAMLYLGTFLSPQKPEIKTVQFTTDSVVNTPQLHYANYCASCHGNKVEAFADRKWNHGKTREDIFQSIKNGYEKGGMPSFKATFKDEEIYNLADYILKAIANVDRYTVADATPKVNFFKSKVQNIKLDTVARNLGVPWAIGFLPNGELLVTERSNKLYLIPKKGEPKLIGGLPKVWVEMQGGLFDVKVHPQYIKNNLVYLSYAAYKINGKDTLSTTAVIKANFDGEQLTNSKIIFEALPYAKTRYHYGAKLAFDEANHLYVSVGDRGSSKTGPQGLTTAMGKIHRINDDGSIPADNPFVNVEGSVKSTFSHGHRNPQGLAFNPFTKQLWENEHGPRGGDEINIIEKGKNYGWPVISYGINYDGTTLTDKVAKDGMEQPVVYWIPSIAPSGMAFVSGKKYKNWNGNVLSGSLRFNYLNRSVIKDNKIVEEEILLKDVGRLRDVKMGPDGYIYIATESPGYIFRLMPVK